MKRKVLLIILLLSVLIIGGCKYAAEKAILNKYFNAVRLNDKTTMGSLAVEPMAFTFSKWEIVSISEEKVGDTVLPKLADEEKKLKNQLDELMNRRIEANDELNLAKSNLENAIGRAAQRKFQAEVEEKQKIHDELFNEWKELQKKYTDAKLELSQEKKVVNLSLLQEIPGVEDMTGTVHVKNVVVNIISPQGTKKIDINLKRYLLKNVLGRQFRGRWIIYKFTPVD
ncbi:MAG: hypothetical protein AB1410_11955 [Acidobacteriota bacterium]